MGQMKHRSRPVFKGYSDALFFFLMLSGGSVSHMRAKTDTALSTSMMLTAKATGCPIVHCPNL